MPDYDKLAAEGPQKPSEAPAEGKGEASSADAMAAVLADPEALKSLAVFAADTLASVMVLGAYVGSSVAPEDRKRLTVREADEFRAAFSAYVASKAGDLEVTPGMVLLGTAVIITAPRVVHAHQDKAAALLSKFSGGGDDQDAAGKDETAYE